MAVETIEQLGDGVDFAAFQRALAGTDPAGLSARDVSRLSRTLNALPGHPGLRIAYMGNVSLSPLDEYVAVLAARQGLRTRAHLGGYDQYMQEALVPDAALASFQPQVVTLFLTLERLRPSDLSGFAALPASRRSELRDEILEHVGSWLRAAKDTLPGTFLISNFVSARRPALGVADTKEAYGEREFRLELNLELLRMLRDEARAHLFDLDGAMARFGVEPARDARLRYLAKMEWSSRFLPVLAAELVRHFRAIAGHARKGLVLDLDGTLWGGVVGEDGPDGIRIGTGDPVGEAFLELQHRVKALQSTGVLLALCSKNNREDVLEAFERRPEMPLRLDDFAALEINWEPKHDNLRRIARTLNIGLDSLVFVDDNPAEIELVRQLLPEVHTLLLPADPAQACSALDGLGEFEKLRVLADDAGKTRQYHENRRREVHRSSVDQLEDYLGSLETVVELAEAAPEDLPRLHQLFSKTNQFNLTTERYTLAELERFLAGDDAVLVKAVVRDRFGDLGMVGAYLLRPRDTSLQIDSFLMSCRAMGRQVETAIMNDLKRRFLGRRFQVLRGRFVPTRKNAPAESFLEEQGFRPVESNGGGGAGAREFLLSRADVAEKPCPWMEVVWR